MKEIITHIGIYMLLHEHGRWIIYSSRGNPVAYKKTQDEALRCMRKWMKYVNEVEDGLV